MCIGWFKYCSISDDEVASLLGYLALLHPVTEQVYANYITETLKKGYNQ